LNEKELTIHYSVGGICEDAVLKFETKGGEWISCTGTDLKKEPIGSFETEIKTVPAANLSGGRERYP